MTGAAAEPLDDEEPTAPEELLDRDRKRPTREWQTFSLDGHPVRVREPKGAVLIPIAVGMASGDHEAMLTAVDRFIDTAFDDASAEHIHDRLEDDDDEFDYEGDVLPLFEILAKRWGTNHGAASRPTGSSRGSSQRSRRTTRRSTAKSR